tara:strand:- start:515 stop:916 length:402 start_codon:yes stop_codon:yes gene_type:complete
VRWIFVRAMAGYYERTAARLGNQSFVANVRVVSKNTGDRADGVNQSCTMRVDGRANSDSIKELQVAVATCQRRIGETGRAVSLVSRRTVDNLVVELVSTQAWQRGSSVVVLRDAELFEQVEGGLRPLSQKVVK